MKEVLSQNEIEFAVIDITSGMLPLKKFLKIRDHNDSHAPVRQRGNVGLPTLEVDGVSYLVEGAEHAERLISELNLKG